MTPEVPFIEAFADSVLTKAGKRRIVSWGYSHAELGRLKRAGLIIDDIYTARKGLEESDSRHNFYHPQHLRDYAGQVFVVFPCNYGLKGAIASLEEWGYESDDWATLFPVSPISLKHAGERLTDLHGNVVSPLPSNVTVSISGYDNHVEIASDTQVTQALHISIRTSGNRISIGAGSRFTGASNAIRVTGARGGTSVDIGEGVRWTGTDANVNSPCELVVGPSTTIENNCRFFVSAHTSVRLGMDCMISTEVLFQSNDGHSIFDVPSGANVNSDSSSLIDGEWLRQVVVGDHVWIGRRAMVMGSATLGSGGIVGAMSFVKGAFPNNCIIGGVPARVLRTDRAWARQNCATSVDIVPKEYVQPTLQEKQTEDEL